MVQIQVSTLARRAAEGHVPELCTVRYKYRLMRQIRTCKSWGAVAGQPPRARSCSAAQESHRGLASGIPPRSVDAFQLADGLRPVF